MSGLKRESVVNFLDNPETGFAVAYAIISLLRIFLTLFAIAFELQAPIFVKQYGWFFSSLEKKTKIKVFDFLIFIFVNYMAVAIE